MDQSISPRDLIARALTAHAAGNLVEAATDYGAALAGDPDNADAHYLLGLLLLQQGHLAQSAAHLSSASRLAPHAAQCHRQLGQVLLALGRMEEAEAALGKATALEPDDAQGWSDLGTARVALGRFEAAEAALRRAITLSPDNGQAQLNLGAALKAQFRLNEAKSAFLKATSLLPTDPRAHFNLGTLYDDIGMVEEAWPAFERAIALGHPQAAALRVRSAMMLPALPRDWDEIHRSRARQLTAVRAVPGTGITIADPLGEVGRTNFRLAYHGLNDREHQVAVAEMYRAISPVLTFTAPHCLAAPRPLAGRRLKLGILSQSMMSHSVGLYWVRTIELMDPGRFDVVILRDKAAGDWIAQRIDQAPAVTASLVMPGDLAGMYRAVADLELDVLLYPDIGMLALSYFAAFARLAPVQCVAFTHPVTTGISTLDYFLSSELDEPEGAEDHYSEHLVRFGHHPTVYPKPDLPSVPGTRAEFGLPEQGTLYFCSQSVYKLHPDIDPCFAGILEGDPEGWIVQILGSGHGWEHQFIDRFRARYGDALADRIILIDRVHHDRFLALTELCDVILDTPHFGGGVTSYQAFTLGKPMVTWPGDYMRARFTLLFYRRMGIPDLIATSPADFARIAVRLGRDEAFRAEMSALIRERADCLFEEVAAVEELQDFFEAAYRAKAAGQPPVDWQPAARAPLPWE